MINLYNKKSKADNNFKIFSKRIDKNYDTEKIREEYSLGF